MNYELPSLRPMDVLGMTQLQLMQMVPVPGKLRLAGLVETARADASATRVADVSFDLRTRAAMAFYDLYAVDGTLGVARDTRRILQDISAIAVKMYQVGEGRQADVLRANVELARMQEDIIRMETMRTTMTALPLPTLGTLSTQLIALSAFEIDGVGACVASTSRYNGSPTEPGSLVRSSTAIPFTVFGNASRNAEEDQGR